MSCGFTLNFAQTKQLGQGSVTVNIPPTGGSFAIYPTTGIIFNTVFTLSAAYWTYALIRNLCYTYSNHCTLAQ